MIHFVQLLDFCDHENKGYSTFISIFLKPFLLHFTHISVLKYSCQSRSLQNSTIVKSRNKVLGLTEANLRFGGTSQDWNLSNLFVNLRRLSGDGQAPDSVGDLQYG
jgi:hypothetical protein